MCQMNKKREYLDIYILTLMTVRNFLVVDIGFEFYFGYLIEKERIREKYNSK